MEKNVSPVLIPNCSKSWVKDYFNITMDEAIFRNNEIYLIL